jgi:nitrogen fixation protein NifM
MNESGSVYLSLKLAAQLFSKPLDALAPDERHKLSRVAARQQQIETLILTTTEAAHVAVPAATVDSSLAEIRARYGSDEDYQADLQRIGLDNDSLRCAVERDLVVDAVLDKVAARAAIVSETEVEIFWFMHKDRFRHAETRTLRHILITINDTLAGNERPLALEKIETIRQRLQKEPARFAEQALKHSECPSATNGGLLGNVPRGQLYPQLEIAAFALNEDELSAVVESELGFHLIWCEAIQPERQSPLEEVCKKIRDHLEQQRRSMCQKSWINGLRQAAVAPPT